MKTTVLHEVWDIISEIRLTVDNSFEMKPNHPVAAPGI